MRKAFAIALTISFTLSPLSALAQEAATDSAATDTGTNSPPPATDTADAASPSPIPDLSIPGVDSSVISPSGDATTDTSGTSAGPSDTPVSPPSSDAALSTTADTPSSDAARTSKLGSVSPMSLSSQGGSGGDPHSDDDRNAITDEVRFQPDAMTGSLSYSYPLTLPPGRNGLTPDLALKYSSQPAANANVVGYGWDFSIPYIERLNRTGSDAMLGQYYFYSTMDGELSSSTPGTYGPISEAGKFLRYKFSTSTNSWTVTDKTGTIYKFGTTASSRQDNPSNSGQIYKWQLDEIRDVNNNYIKYTYTKDSGQIYPNQILYTGNGSIDGPFEVDFLKQSRGDIATSSQPGFQIVSKYRINEIDVKVSGSWIRKYALSYATADNQSRSLLSAIQLTGQNDVGTVVAQPSTTFSYQQATAGWTATSTSWNSPTAFSNQIAIINGDLGVRLADANGDGLVDVLQGYRNSDGSTVIQQAWINTGFGFVSSSTWNPPTYFNNRGLQPTSGDNGTRIVDVNGDGLPDLVQSWDNSDGTASSIVTYINTGNGWTASSTWSSPIFITDYKSNVNTGDVGVRMEDVNGDGLVDIAQSYCPSGGGGTNAMYLNNGNGWTLATSSIWHIPACFADYQTGGISGDTGVRVADANGDGLPDILQGYRNADGSSVINQAWINTGSGWSLDNTWAPPAFFADLAAAGSAADVGTRILDVNGDGLPDVVQGYDNIDGTNHIQQTWINTGGGWTSSSPWAPPLYFIDYKSAGDQGVRAVDWDGDNMTDLIQAWGVTPAFNNYLNNAKRVDLLTSVTSPAGGQTSYQYRQSALYSSGASSQLSPHLPVNLDTVSSVAASDGLGTISTTTLSYSGGTYYFNGPYDRRLAGFSKIISTDGAGNYTNTFYHTGIGTDSAHGEYQDTKAKIGNAYRIEHYDSSNNLISKDIMRWDQTSLGGARYFVFPQSTVSSAYANGGSHQDAATKNIYENTYGNIIQKLQYGEVTGSDDGTFSDAGTDYASTTITYAASTSPYIVGLPWDEITQDQSSNKVRETRHYYDGLSLGNVALGNETKTESWITSSTYASTTKAYDGTYGLVTQSRDADGNLTTNTLDGKNLYVATSTNALSQTTGYQYDYSTGKVKATYDPNGRLSTTLYDGLGRPLTVSEPDPSSGSLVTKTTYAYTDSNSPGSTSVLKTDFLSSATSTATYSYLDGLNRKLQDRKQAKGNNTYAVKDWTYNNLGLLSSESLPYFASSTARASATSTSQLFTTYTYDALQRVLKTANSVGSTTNLYSAWTVTTTDANGKVKDYTKDAYGNLASVVEHVAGTYATTSYAWDLNKSLTKLTDALGNVRNFTYDGLGERLTAQDLHATADSSFGSWSYTFDPAGNLTQVVDPKSQTINYGYDALNRKATEDYTGQAGVEVTNTYDTCTDGKGRLCVASSTSIRTAYNYNPLGLQSSASSTINSTSTAFVTQYSYDRLGNKTLITYPDNAQVQYNYNGAGLIDAVIEKENGGNFSNIANNFDYSPVLQPTSIVLANGAVTTNSYDQNSLYRLTKKVTTLSNGTHAQDLAYTYDALGNITKIIDNGVSGTGRVVNYAYDNLSRLLSASTTIASSTPYSYSYTYDALGNITNGPLGTYSYLGSIGTNYANPDAVTAYATTTTTITGGGGTSTSTIALTSTTTNITLGFNSTTTKTWTVTTSGSNPLIVLTAGIWQDIGGSGTIGSASWNGAAFTKATSTRTTANETEIWYLVASTTGSKTISVTINGNTDAIKLGTASLSGVSTSAPFDTVKSAYGFSTTPSVSVTPRVSNEVFVDALARWTTLDATTSLTSLYKNYASSTLAAASYMIATTSSNVTETYTAGGTSQDWVLAMAAFQPATSTTGTASTTAATTTLSYDNNGNLTAEGSTTYSWDYRNQLTQSGNGLATSTYAYDQDGNRVKLTEGAVTIYFPNTLYSTGATTTKNIFANGMLISTIEGSGSSSGGGSGISTSTIALDATSTNITLGFNNSITKTWTHTVTGSNPLIVLTADIWQDVAGAGTISSATWNGASFTKATSSRTTANDAEIWYLVATTTGPKTLSVTITGDTDAIKLGASSYTGVSPSWAFDAVNSVNGWAGSPSISITPTTSGDVGVTTLARWTTEDATTSLIALYKNYASSTLAAASYKVATTSGAITDTYTVADGGSQDWVIAMASFRPATTTTGGGSTGSTTVRYIANDNISGSNIVMDSSGVAEALDYLPYGGLRLDTKTNYGGVRNKYAGTIYDVLSGLNYMQARYENANRGQFISEDPSFLAVGDQGQLKQVAGQDQTMLLADPQQMNSSGYGRDNPITRSDPLGKYAVDYSRPVNSSGPLSNFSHSFVYIVPQPGEVLPPIDSNGMSIDTSRPFVLGAFPVGGRLTMRANDATDLAIASRNQSVPGIGRADVLPSGMSPAQYDANIVNAFNSLPADQGWYDPIGARQTFGSSNSNNANTSLLISAGLSQSKVNSLVSQLSLNSKWAPGIGIPLNAPTYYQSALSSLAGQTAGH